MTKRLPPSLLPLSPSLTNYGRPAVALFILDRSPRSNSLPPVRILSPSVQRDDFLNYFLYLSTTPQSAPHPGAASCSSHDYIASFLACRFLSSSSKFEAADAGCFVCLTSRVNGPGLFFPGGQVSQGGRSAARGSEGLDGGGGGGRPDAVPFPFTRSNIPPPPSLLCSFAVQRQRRAQAEAERDRKLGRDKRRAGADGGGG